MKTINERLAEYPTDQLIGTRDQAVKQLDRLGLNGLRVAGGLAFEGAFQSYFEKNYGRSIRMPVLGNATPVYIRNRFNAVCRLGRRIDMELETRADVAKRFEGIVR